MKTVSHRILNMNASLRSFNQPQLCKQMLDVMTRDDMDGLLIVTSNKRISISSKLLQIFSPLYRDILRDIDIKDNGPVTMIIPDTEAVHVKHLLDLVTSGKINATDISYDEMGSLDIVALAESFKIDLRETDLLVPLVKDIRQHQTSTQRIKVKQEISSPDPCHSFLNEIELRNADLSLPLESAGQNPPPKIKEENSHNISSKGPCLGFQNNNEENDYQGGKCSFCNKKRHEKRCRGNKDQPRHRPALHFPALHFPLKCNVCPMRYSNQQSLFAHMTMKHFEHCLPFHCSFCNQRFNKLNFLKRHITVSHKRIPIKPVYNFPEGEEAPSCFFDTL